MPPTVGRKVGGKPKKSLQALKRQPSTANKNEFARMVKAFKERPNIVAEGDSWFDYPRRALLAGPPSNIVRCIEKRTKGKVNMLRLASNGDEMTGMMSSEQRHTVTRILDKYHKMSRPINVLFYSGGGNDVVGRWDLERFLNPHKPGFSAEDCVNSTRLKNKVRQIELAYIELFEIRNQYSPDTVIITDTYDVPYVTGKGAEFLGIKFVGPWIKPAMETMNIPKNLRRAVCRILIEALGNSLTGLQSHSAAKEKFLVSKTQGTLTSENQWLNELHPTSAGFELIAKKVYKNLKSVVMGLPSWS